MSKLNYLKFAFFYLFVGLVSGCSDSDSASTSTSSLQLPQQLEVVTNEND
ncbi:hypothetical protein LRP49_02880 [Enterovibrio sp. ZSDZ35]|uniref:Uncharacterized protein n=1 Tax=Enterovibrio qingdaonensis TaxID=2899818 RepID=A0ABT5QI28_9GAMM|nr:hypothetical protein [Enterovibrio sp. ZSDZ35]MDD1780135.1 hypothetical protein [Enterovibrio sp. ZSDZ35]